MRLPICVALVLLLSACSAGPGEQSGRNPLAGQAFHLDQDGHAVQQVLSWKQAGRDDLAAKLAPLADQPTATWFGGGRDPYAPVQKLTSAAEAAHRLPVLVVYNLPGRDCGLYSRGGAENGEDYLAWVGSFAAGIANRPALVIVEPDAIAQTLQGCANQDSATRYRLLRSAVEILKRQPHTFVYIDAGNASWVKDTQALADALGRSGVDFADGFALNVSNFETTDSSDVYGRALAHLLSGKHFVIDTSRNGVGPPQRTGDHSSWCNPVGRRLGAPPTTDTGRPFVDAYLWVKQPGDSDGECRAGQPPAGQWSVELAADLLGVPLTSR